MSIVGNGSLEDLMKLGLDDDALRESIDPAKAIAQELKAAVSTVRSDGTVDIVFKAPPGAKFTDIPYDERKGPFPIVVGMHPRPRRPCVHAETCDCGTPAVARVWFSRAWEFLCRACLDRYLPTRRDADVQSLGGCVALDAAWNRCDGSYSRPKLPDPPPGNPAVCDCGSGTERERADTITSALTERMKLTGVSMACPRHGLRVDLGSRESFDVVPLRAPDGQWYTWHDKVDVVVGLLAKAWADGDRSIIWAVTEHGVEEMPEGW